MKREALQIGEGNEKAKNRLVKVGAGIKITGKFLTKTNFSSWLGKKTHLSFASVTLSLLNVSHICPWYLSYKKKTKPKTKTSHCLGFHLVQ